MMSFQTEGPPHYVQRGCVRVTEESDLGTVSRWDCSSVEQRSSELCYNDGVAFAPGSVIDYPYDNLTNHYVGLGSLTVYDKCTCLEKTGESILELAHFECQLPTATEDEKSNPETQENCDNDGRIYNDGQIMYGYSESKCDRCVCRKGKPVCKPLSCGFDLFHWTQFARGCVPSYDEGLCCGRLFMRCPKDTDVVIPSENPTPSNQTCKFGSLILNIGDSIPFDPETCDECACQEPPMLTCSGRKNCRPLRVV
ncbi:uncharacterized protein LOC113378012 isoform X2 [Ctenocephalides felis]|uniref:uncharacterized protein LOC113378012 isoform X2 n=1 Tax=Ctenocephalides felis TaxID=7515 RepID=UPI000E6E2DA4|nr:uncharacterized protein LOC113378012 isoform X2 [Ctenocephalides felis]